MQADAARCLRAPRKVPWKGNVQADVPRCLRARKVPWNYWKALVGRDGKPMKAFGPTVDPLSFEDDVRGPPAPPSRPRCMCAARARAVHGQPASEAGSCTSSKPVRASPVCLLRASLQRHGSGLMVLLSKCAHAARAPAVSARLATRPRLCLTAATQRGVGRCAMAVTGGPRARAGAAAAGPNPNPMLSRARRCGCCWPARASSRPSARCTPAGSAAWSSASWRHRARPGGLQGSLPAGSVPREAAVHAPSGLCTASPSCFQPVF